MGRDDHYGHFDFRFRRLTLHRCKTSSEHLNSMGKVADSLLATKFSAVRFRTAGRRFPGRLE